MGFLSPLPGSEPSTLKPRLTGYSLALLRSYSPPLSKADLRPVRISLLTRRISE
jgi:hypothetical protein